MDNTLYIKNRPLDDFSENIFDFSNFKNKLTNYKGTNLKQANIFFNNVLNDEERKILFMLFHSEKGWYRKIDGIEGIKLKLSAYSLGFTHNKFKALNLPKDKILAVMKELDDTTLSKINNCYLKQKIISKKTIINYINYVNTKNKIKFDNNKILLYRGLKVDDSPTTYLSNNLESWTSQFNIAQRFAGQTGIILKLNIDIENILCCRKTTFKHPNLESLHLKEKINQGQLIRREYEFIIEFTQESFKLEQEQDNIYILK